MGKAWFRLRLFGNYKAAKPEGRGRAEQRSASDLSTQATALLLSTSPKTDKELSMYKSLTSNLSAVPKLKCLIINHLYSQNKSAAQCFFFQWFSSWNNHVWTLPGSAMNLGCILQGHMEERIQTKQMMCATDWASSRGRAAWLAPLRVIEGSSHCPSEGGLHDKVGLFQHDCSASPPKKEVECCPLEHVAQKQPAQWLSGQEGRQHPGLQPECRRPGPPGQAASYSIGPSSIPS